MSLLYLHLAKVRSYTGLGTKKGTTLLCGGLDAPPLDRHVKKQVMSCWPAPLPVLLLLKKVMR